jgi:hypothetical protein
MAADLADAVPTTSALADIYESYLQMLWIETDASELLAEFSAPTLIDDVRGQATVPHDLMVKDFIAAESFPMESV